MNSEIISDPIRLAMNDYFSGHLDAELIANNNYGQPEKYPIKYFFRSEDDIPEIESYALKFCAGRILDIGSGVGPHTTLLQRLGKDVTAIDNSPVMASTMIKQGIKKIICEDIFSFKCRGYNTAILLMNGIGIVGTINRFHTFLKKMEEVLQYDGQLLFDSTDISYVYKTSPKLLNDEEYYGEIKYQFQYKQKKGEWFSWLYIDSQTLLDICKDSNWHAQIIFENEYGQYLSRLVRK